MSTQRPTTLELIRRCAEIPCFSSFEDRIHPYIKSLVEQCPQAHLEQVPIHNLMIVVEGDPKQPPVALSAHLDKIDHFNDPQLTTLPVTIDETEITGQMDDTAGLGICLSLMLQSQELGLPTLYILLSEMEESYGLRYHPERLLDDGKGRHAGMGAERLAEHLIETNRLPSYLVTLDTTPLFKGKPGLALYSKHWEKNGLEPTPALIEATTAIEQKIQALMPEITLANNTNDYLKYGKALNEYRETPIPCIAIEPSIFPYHQAGEKCFLKDIEVTEALTIALLKGQTAL